MLVKVAPPAEKNTKIEDHIKNEKSGPQGQN